MVYGLVRGLSLGSTDLNYNSVFAAAVVFSTAIAMGWGLVSLDFRTSIL